VTSIPRLLAVAVGGALIWLVAAAQLPSQTRMPVSSVVTGAVVSQPYGCTDLDLEPFDPFCSHHHFHTGVDLAAPSGTEVRSATSGVARTAFDPAGAGLFVTVIVNPHVRILYCHLSAFRVADGEAVAPGQLIGLVGMTGLATGAHVHFEIDVDAKSVDPDVWLASG
jgi:murein DD-endopeptidase MepM/ murein hydrolase activator NlpD